MAKEITPTFYTDYTDIDAVYVMFFTEGGMASDDQLIIVDRNGEMYRTHYTWFTVEQLYEFCPLAAVNVTWDRYSAEQTKEAEKGWVPMPEGEPCPGSGAFIRADIVEKFRQEYSPEDMPEDEEEPWEEWEWVLESVHKMAEEKKF